MDQTFCCVPQANLDAAAANPCQWPAGHVIRWTIGDKLPQFTDDEYLEVCRLAWAPWEAESGVRLRYTDGTPNVILTTRRIDGQAGVLAEAQLPCGNVTPTSQLRMWADTSENWTNAENPTGRMFDALRVLMHEFGHLLGISHINGDRALMNPRVSEIRTLQPPDIQEARRRYGDPSETPEDVDPCEKLIRQLFQTDEGRRFARIAWRRIRKALDNG